MGPLSGLRVLELGQLVAGPFCGQILGDFGAEVIKVEEPGVGDPMRQWGREKANGESLWWPIIARNKKSVTCNLRIPQGQKIVARLAQQSDILVENFRPGRLEEWGLGYSKLSQLNPGLIMVRVSGFGQSGPYSKKAGFGSIGEAMGGLRYVVGHPESPPSRVGISVGDSMAGTMAAIGVLVALHARSKTGQGQIVDASIYEAVLAFMESLIPEFEVSGHIRERTGSILPNVAPSNLYKTADGTYILIAANQDSVFRRLAREMGREELADDPRFSTHSARGEHMQELDNLISDWTATFQADDLLESLDNRGVPAGRIYRAPDMLSDPHFASRQSIIQAEHQRLGPISMQNVFPKLDDTPGEVRWVGPDLGAHNDEILAGLLELTDAEIEAAQTQSSTHPSASVRVD